jgi:flagellum-specific peptidoglycan hydrolase FlgJ
MSTITSILWIDNTNTTEEKKTPLIINELYDDVSVYAGRFDTATSEYINFGLPTDRKWLTRNEWKGEHIKDKRKKKLFKQWKKMHIKSFIKKWSRYAQEESAVSGVPASIIIAQTILESNFGLSKLAAEGNNFFGHKYRGKNPDKFLIAHDDSPRDKFTIYKSTWWSLRYHTKILNGMYKSRLKGRNIKDWCECLCGGMSVTESRKFVVGSGIYNKPKTWNGGMVYATSCFKGKKSYAQKVYNIIKYYKLNKYDLNVKKRMAKPTC